MGKLTNRYGLPQPLYDAIANDKYSKSGWISTTQLIDSPQIRTLRKKHWKDIEEDAMDMVWALLGTATHHIIERAAEGNENYLSEIGLELEVLGKTLSGTADLYDKQHNALYDFKVTSVWNIALNDDLWKWEAQTNVYAHMLRKAGHPVDKIFIIGILKDWKQAEALKSFQNGRYPEKQIATVPMTVYSEKAMDAYIEKRMKLHIDAEEGEIVECNEKERWTKPTKYAVMSPTKSRALKVCDTSDEAQGFIDWRVKQKKDKDLFIEKRDGANPRCDNYCPVSDWCPQYADIVKNS